MDISNTCDVAFTKYCILYVSMYKLYFTVSAEPVVALVDARITENQTSAAQIVKAGLKRHTTKSQSYFTCG